MLKAREASVHEMLGANGTSLGVASVEVDGAEPQPSDGTRGSLQDLVMCGAGIGVLGSVAPGDASPAPRSSGTMGLGVRELFWLCSLAFRPHLSTRDGWGMMRSSRVHGSPLWRSCCMRYWPWSTRRS
jgi:hypothetical protein